MRKNTRLDIQLNTMAGDVRDSVVGLLRTQGKSWAAMSEGEQRIAADRAYNLGREIATKAAQAVAAAGSPFIAVTIGKYQETEKGIKAEFTLGEPDDNDVLALRSIRGRAAVLIAADADDYMNARKDVEIDLDQKVLDLDDEADQGDEAEDLGEAVVHEILVGQRVRTAGGNEGVVRSMRPQHEGDPLKGMLTTDDGAEVEAEIAEVLVPNEGGEEGSYAVPVAEWLTAQAHPADEQNLAAVEEEFKPSGVFEVGEPVIVPLSADKTANGHIIARDEGGTQFTVKTLAGSELDVTFEELNAVNPEPQPAAAPTENGEGKKKRTRKPRSTAADANAMSAE